MNRKVTWKHKDPMTVDNNRDKSRREQAGEVTQIKMKPTIPGGGGGGKGRTVDYAHT